MKPTKILDTATRLRNLADTLTANPQLLAERQQTWAAIGYPTHTSGTPTTPSHPTDPDGHPTTPPTAAERTPDKTAIAAQNFATQINRLNIDADDAARWARQAIQTNPATLECDYCAPGRIKPGRTRCDNPKCSTSTNAGCPNHPDRAAIKKGLCETCYKADRRGRRKGPKSVWFHTDELLDETRIKT